jgi:hypothetical protein
VVVGPRARGLGPGPGLGARGGEEEEEEGEEETEEESGAEYHFCGNGNKLKSFFAGRIQTTNYSTVYRRFEFTVPGTKPSSFFPQYIHDIQSILRRTGFVQDSPVLYSSRVK